MALGDGVASALDAAYKDFAERNPKSKEASLQAEQSMPGGNTRTTLFSHPFPVTLVKGSGNYLWDVDGHKYIDSLGEFTAGITGHSHPVIVAAVRNALEDGINLGGHGPLEAQLSQAIKSRIPSMELMRFCNSGTEANLMNIQTARAFTGRNKVMVFEGAYHGGVFSFPIGKRLATTAPFDFVMAPYNNVAAVEKLIATHGSDLACVLVEPMIGSGGCIPATQEFLQALRLGTEQVGALMILDEVMTSRLSPGGLQQTFNITPDLTSIGKYIGGGMTFGGFGGREDIMSIYDPRRQGCMFHSGTFNNNVLTMSAGVAVMTKVCTPDAVNAMNARGDALRTRLNDLADKHGASMQWTGIGSMMMAHFTTDPVSSPHDVEGQDLRLRELMYFHVLKRNVWMTSKSMINLSLVTGEQECRAIADAVEDFLITYSSLLQGREP